MRVLHVHNFYQLPGGEDQCFATTGAMLEDFGHGVVRFTMHNDMVSEVGSVTAAKLTVWNSSAYRKLRQLIRSTRPALAHFENTFPLVSPSAYYACHAEGVPVVQTLHNFRLICPSAIFYRNGGVCEKCLGKKVAWPSIQHRCYRNSRLGSAVVAAMLAVHRAAGTWAKQVDAYITLNGFARTKLIEGGLDADRIHVNPNFLGSTPEPGDGAGGYALFAGRLTQEKGIRTLVSAWEELGSDLPLKILGDGPEANHVAEAAARYPGIEWLGWRPVEEVLKFVSSAKFVVLPSVWYEVFNRILLEGLAKGTPIIASRLGSMEAIVEHGRTGLLFAPNDPADLIRQVRWLLGSPDSYARMRLAARREFETHYTAEASHDRLMRIYAAAREQMNRRASH
jgi:glycosyltransferase involved in cell wall biosynthesis